MMNAILRGKSDAGHLFAKLRRGSLSLKQICLMAAVLVGGLAFEARAAYVESYEVAEGKQENLAAAMYKDLTIRGLLGGRH